ncbi:MULTISPECIES: histone-like nucleoid-structuring protein, MvaT/MvaU family [Pseudomonas]|uniref:histone-like nucleoid-structuring protein, MvaT/MvaU family n=1 Tax=Pseudomonas TaxID=286 RepID=UPI0008636138|nr:MULTISPECIES: histone-like nucleoid-structuring protein, MvaT/MvaU family [Pseudomonas]MCE0882901.1 DNA binding protein [Pseudomonas putida]MCE0962842.1 DNA binding protein [Pseudomonas putida]MDG9889965.1 DNA binding protein [Pseudomonas juntendi]QOH70627.1 DNA binding protein [Pseudomonas putida]RFQ03436.1 transcriptional regulator [Pseudomonas putida]
MSRLVEFRTLEQELAKQLAQLESLKNDEQLKHEIEFEKKLRDLLAEYQMGLRQVISILDPQANTAGVATPVKAERKARVVKRYKNPHSGEVIETKGGNHKALKAWKTQYGADVVESWLA